MKQALVYCTAVVVAAACSFDPLGGASGPAGTNDGGSEDAAADTDARPQSDASAADGGGGSATANIDCASTDTAPEIDGDVGGPWLDANFIVFRSQDGELIADKHPSYDFDSQVSFSCLHDQDKIYFMLDITDDSIEDNSLALREDDGVVLFIDGLGDRSGTYGVDDHALMLAAEADSHDYGPGTLEPNGFVVTGDDGYRFEVELIKTEVASPLAQVLGFNIALIDDDGLGNNNRDVFSLRHVPEAPACSDCCEGQAEPWCNTEVTGTLTLLE